MVFLVGASDVAERGVVNGRGEIGKRNFALSEGVGRRSEQAGLCTHGMLRGVLDVVGYLKGLSTVAENGASLAEGSGGAEKA